MEWTQGWPMFYNVWIRETYDLSTVILTNCYYFNAPEGFWLCKWLVFIAVTRCKFGTFWSPQNQFLLENQNIPKNPRNLKFFEPNQELQICKVCTSILRLGCRFWICQNMWWVVLIEYVICLWTKLLWKIRTFLIAPSTNHGMLQFNELIDGSA